MSRKIRSAAQQKGKSGKPLATHPCFGYVKDPDDKNHWLIDPEATATVRRIFELAASGLSQLKICRTLVQEKRVTPGYYLAQREPDGFGRQYASCQPYNWARRMICKIVRRQEYLGHTVNFKTCQSEYRGKQISVPAKDQLVFTDTHDPIVDEQLWQAAQRIFHPEMSSAPGKPCVFNGLMVCGECGVPMQFHRTVTDDGVDIPPYSAMEDYDETGAYCEMREFETPLPAELSDRKELNVSIKMYQQETTVWFDGQNCYIKYDRSEVGHMDATIPLTKDAVQIMEGSGEINGVKCEATATVSKMAASVTVNCEAPVNTFLAAAPEGTDKHDMWVDVLAVDESGNKFRAQEAIMLDDSTSFSLPFLGTGTMPKTLTIYVYSMWEGIDDPDLTTLDGIVLTITK